MKNLLQNHCFSIDNALQNHCKFIAFCKQYSHSYLGIRGVAYITYSLPLTPYY
jgi:hypothetical protein